VARKEERPHVSAGTIASGLDRPRTRREVLKAGAAAAAATAFATHTVGASSYQARRTQVSASALDPTKTVQVWIQGYGAEQGPVLDSLAAQFKQETGVTVQFETVDWSTAEQRWNLAMSTGDVPDIGDMFYLPQRIVQGRDQWGPLDLTSYIDAGQFGDWERIVQASRDESTFDGKVYGIPWRIDIRGWNARSDLWPTVPTTLDEMESQGMEVLAKAGVQGAGSWFPNGTDDLNMAGLAYGTTILTPDYTASNLLDPKWIDAATWMRDMARKRILLTESIIDPSFDYNGAFFSGIVGAQWGGVTLLEGALAQAPDVAPLVTSGLMPAGPVGESRSHGSCAQWSVFQNSEAIDEAVAFLSWLTTDPQRSLQVNQSTSSLSADTTVQELQSTPYLAPYFEQAKTLSLSDMPIPAWGEMRVAPDGPLETLGKRIIGSDDDLATLFKDADTAITEIFAKYA
jgi:multiple sugar transport system substrate-binding protein